MGGGRAAKGGVKIDTEIEINEARGKARPRDLLLAKKWFSKHIGDWATYGDTHHHW